jgi:hypothetical protein
MFFVSTDKAVHFLDHAGHELLAAPLAYDPTTDQVLNVGHLVNPDRYYESPRRTPRVLGVD